MEAHMQGDMLERKFMALGEVEATGDVAPRLSGYASIFDEVDGGGDVVAPGAYAASLKRLAAAGRRIKMLWQHDPAQPIGVWDAVSEDARGLKVSGRLLDAVEKGREAAALLSAGAIDGLSIGYRTVRAEKDANGRRRLLEVDLWEVSLVTFPMLGLARASAKSEDVPASLDDLARALRDARRELAAGALPDGR